MNAIIPVPSLPITIREGVATDLVFIDALQKKHRHMVGFMPGKQIEGKIAAGHVVVAEDATTKTPVGYCVAQDTYAGRDDVGIIYQLNVEPMRQRGLIGASLVKAVFERAAYGCRLFCLWCAQDIRANFFWEAIGFVPLAFRTGSASMQRTHIFWQRRIREGDVGQGGTPWWFPAQTKGGAISSERLVLPIPPGVHWRDQMPVLLPEVPAQVEEKKPLTLPGGAPVSPRPQQPKLTPAQRAALHRGQSRHLQGVPLGKKAVLTSSGIRYVDRTDYVPETDAPEELIASEAPKPKKPPKPRAKVDPAQAKAARELRDRWLEQVNAGAYQFEEAGKYDVSKTLSAVEGSRALPEMSAKAMPLLPAA